MEKRQVKGTMLLDYIRMIKSSPDKDWKKYLLPEDWEVVNGRVLPSMWYSFDTFQRCGMAAFYIIAGGNLDTVRAWGKISFGYLLENIYKSIVKDSDPLKAIERFIIMRGQFFNFAAFAFEKIDEKHALVKLTMGTKDPGIEPYSMQLAGGFERLVELCGGRNAKVELKDKEWKGAANTVFDIKWE